MLVSIFSVFGFNIELQIFRNFFDIVRGNADNHDNGIDRIMSRIYNWLTRHFNNTNNENIKFIVEQLIKVLKIRIGLSVLLGFFDFIPGGFVLSGVLNAIINSPFLYKIGNQSKIFLSKKIMISGGRQNILNIIEGYRDSISLIENLSNKNDWTRKIQIIK